MMAKTEPKTTETTASVSDFIRAIPDASYQQDCLDLLALMQEVSGFEPKMWGPSIIGFGAYHYRYESGHEGDAPLVAFSPRKAAISIYLSSEFAERAALLGQFGKHKSAKSCIYVKKLADIDTAVLRTMVAHSLAHTKSQYTTA